MLSKMRSLAPSLRASAGIEVNTDIRVGRGGTRTIAVSQKPPTVAKPRFDERRRFELRGNEAAVQLMLI